MRMSCNGCRVLRKGCSENCSIRPCLQWIPSPNAQANATVFLAKFYGRAGLINLINAGPEPLRPGIFRSLLYEACGRIVNPVYGSAGLLMSGSWHLCQAAVEAVLSGAPIVQVSSDSSIGAVSPPLKACDIRHVSRDEASLVAGAGQELPRVVKTRSRFKRSSSAAKPKPKELCAPPTAGVGGASEFETEPTRFKEAGEELLSRQPSHGSESDSASVETVEATLMKLDDPTYDNNNVELDLTLGFQPRPKARKVVPMMYGLGDATCKVEMTFDLLAA